MLGDERVVDLLGLDGRALESLDQLGIGDGTRVPVIGRGCGADPLRVALFRPAIGRRHRTSPLIAFGNGLGRSAPFARLALGQGSKPENTGDQHQKTSNHRPASSLGPSKSSSEHRATNRHRLMLSVPLMTRRVAEKPVPTFSPGAPGQIGSAWPDRQAGTRTYRCETAQEKDADRLERPSLRWSPTKKGPGRSRALSIRF